MLSMNPKEHLSNYHFKTGEKIMGLGKPRVEKLEDIGARELRKYEKEHLTKLEKSYADIKSDMDELEKNYLNGMFLRSLSSIHT